MMESIVIMVDYQRDEVYAYYNALTARCDATNMLEVRFSTSFDGILTIEELRKYDIVIVEREIL